MNKEKSKSSNASIKFCRSHLFYGPTEYMGAFFGTKSRISDVLNKTPESLRTYFFREGA